MKLVGLCGYARSGKDTAAKALISLGWKRVAFADKLKDEVARATGWDCGTFARKLELDPGFKDAVRPLLVGWGHFRRWQRADYWVDKAFSGAYYDMRSGVVVTDVRYRNEADFIRDCGGVVVLVTRPGTGPANEEEGRSIPEIDPTYTIVNSGTEDDLRNALVNVLGLNGEKDAREAR